MEQDRAPVDSAAEKETTDQEELRDRMTLEHTADEYDKYLNAVVPPVFLNSLHAYSCEDDYRKVDIFSNETFVYARDSNPTVSILERKIAELEHGCRAVVFSSGMAAFTSLFFTVCKTGSHIICMKDVYMPVKRFLDGIAVPRLGMSVTYVSGNDLQEIEDAARGNTDLMILESPATFVFRVVDLRAIAEIAKRKGFRTYIDNTCLSPIFQKPLDLGIDFSMHTMSKFMGGHSDIVGGVVVGKDDEIMRKLVSPYREFLGGCMGPMEAWLTIRGLRTLDVRMHEFMRTGMAVASFLEGHPKVRRVYYTGLASHPQAEIIRKQQKGHSSLMSLELDSDSPEDAKKFVDHLKVFQKGCSWGGFESLALLPLYDEPEKALDLIGQKRGLIRLYCGLEGSENLIADLEQALDKL